MGYLWTAHQATRYIIEPEKRSACDPEATKTPLHPLLYRLLRKQPSIEQPRGAPFIPVRKSNVI